MGLLERLDKKAPMTPNGANSPTEADEPALLRERVHYQVVEALNKRDEKSSGGTNEAEIGVVG